jgi:hypothetical protein
MSDIDARGLAALTFFCAPLVRRGGHPFARLALHEAERARLLELSAAIDRASRRRSICTQAAVGLGIALVWVPLVFGSLIAATWLTPGFMNVPVTGFDPWIPPLVTIPVAAGVVVVAALFPLRMVAALAPTQTMRAKLEARSGDSELAAKVRSRSRVFMLASVPLAKALPIAAIIALTSGPAMAAFVWTTTVWWLPPFVFAIALMLMVLQVRRAWAARWKAS